MSPKAKGGDGDPLDICVISERPINRAEIVLDARVIGGLQMIDGGEADDKIVAVLHNDNVWGSAEEIGDVPNILIERLRHYFLTYKLVPGETGKQIEIDATFGADHAHALIEAALQDYLDEYGE